jgi:hypothetical protein
MQPDNNHEEIKRLLVENQRLLTDNNNLLHKMRRDALLGSFFKIIWFIIIIGGPVYIYFNYIQPNMDTLKVKYNELEQMTSDTSAIKEWYESVSKPKAE